MNVIGSALTPALSQRAREQFANMTLLWEDQHPVHHQIAAADDGRVAVFARQPGERCGNVLQVFFDQRQALADL